MANHLNYVTSLDVLEENLTAPVPQVVSGCFAVVYEPGSMPNLNVDPGAMGTIHLLKTYQRGNFKTSKQITKNFCAMDIPSELLIASNNEKLWLS